MNDLVKQSFSMQRSTNEPNSQVCACGEHKGRGSTSPHELAMIFNWNRKNERAEYEQNSEHQKEYLQTYEATHGRLGENEFIFNTGRFAHFDKGSPTRRI